MKVIHKKISLEPYRSRINGSLTSYNEYGVEQPFENYKKPTYNETNEKIIQKMYNYNMFPYDVICPKDKCNSDKDLILSYPTLMNRYYFCKHYKSLLKNNSKCNESEYNDALELFKHSVKYQIKDLEQEYTNLDEIYNSYGGKSFLDWCENILYGGNVDYNNFTNNLCSNCGDEQKWCDDETALINDIKNSSHINIPILFTNTIDDMGEYSIFCEEWEDGIKYNKGDLVIYDDRIWEKNNIDDGYIYSKKYKERYFPQIGDGTFEHIYDKQWYDKSSGQISGSTNQWVDYTDKYFSGNGIPNAIDYDECNINKSNYNTLLNNKLPINTKYSVRNGKLFYNADAKEDMSLKYNIITNDNGFFVIDNKIYEILQKNYIEYEINSEKKYFFTYEVDNFIQLNMKYCYIKGQKIYSRTKDNGVHYFLIDDKEIEEKTLSYFIEYQGNAYKINNNKIVIEGVTYNKIKSYVNVDGILYFINDNNKIISFKLNEIENGSEYSLDETLVTRLGKLIENANNSSSGYSITDNTLYVYKPYNEYSVSGMSGYTESKLSSLKTYGSSFDDMGNELPGTLKIENEKYVQPTENDYLELPYKIGNTNELTPFYNEDGSLKYYFGNILTSITLYYVDFYGNKVNDTIIECNKNDSILNKITECETKLNEFLVSHKDDNYIAENHHSINKEIKCNFKYHMGAIIKNDKSGVLNGNEGVTYEEEVTLIKKSFEYKYDEISSYIIYYYDIVYNETFDVLNEYSNNTCKVGKSFFSYKIDDLINPPTNRVKYDGMIASPIFREEYKFGSSSLENIQRDIYIDRGFSSSFEKHLKLLDVNSMESLENYGNGFYNIIES